MLKIYWTPNDLESELKMGRCSKISMSSFEISGRSENRRWDQDENH